MLVEAFQALPLKFERNVIVLPGPLKCSSLTHILCGEEGLSDTTQFSIRRKAVVPEERLDGWNSTAAPKIEMGGKKA